VHAVILTFALLDPSVLGILQKIGVRGSSAYFDEMEAAAFIVQEPTGHFASVDWPATTAGVRTARHEGTIPQDTIALAHTHPFTAPKPSRGDIEQAKKIRLPIYVISRWSLYVVEPSGEVTALIVRKDWTRYPKPAELRAEQK
jgi:proteasome lid subunit RPN8/RPN11